MFIFLIQISFSIFLIVEIRIKAGDNVANFNHTLALILAEYASAVSFFHIDNCDNQPNGYQNKKVKLQISSL